MMFTKDEHAANGPATWRVDRAGRTWRLLTKDGVAIGTGYRTKRAAEQDRESGFYVDLYAKEGRWYAGEPVPGWRPYAEVARTS